MATDNCAGLPSAPQGIQSITATATANLSMSTQPPHCTVEFDNKNPSVMRQVRAALDDTPEVGEVLLRIEHFAFTANNVTYAMFGDAMHSSTSPTSGVSSSATLTCRMTDGFFLSNSMVQWGG